MQTKNKIILLVGIVFTACNPIYQTRYTYYPISDSSGRQCANNCSHTKQNCHSTIDFNYQSCLNSSELSYQACNASKVHAYDPVSKSYICVANCFCLKPTCDSPNYSDCENNYANCYLNCGGEVLATKSCVKFCKDAQPSATQLLSRKTKAVSKPASIAKVSNKVNPKPNNENNSEGVLGQVKSSPQSELEQINNELRAKISK